MKRFPLVLCALVLAAVPGCNDGPECPESPDSATTILAQGTADLLPGRYWGEIGCETASVSVSQPGMLVARVTGSDASAVLHAGFLHPATDPVYPCATARGPSPQVLTVAVSSAHVQAGHKWLFYASSVDTVGNLFGTASYTIMFTPD